MTTFSTSLKLELPGDGQQTGTWGQTTNKNLGTLLEQAITGVQAITMADANYTLTNLNGTVDEARNAVLVIGGINTAVRDVIAPLVEKLYTVINNTTGGYAIRIKGSTGATVTIPSGLAVPVYCDGTNFYSLLNGAPGDFTITANGYANNLVVTNNINAATANFSGAITAVSPSFTGTPTAPTASPGANSTQIATTAFVTAVTATLGTMATQNANAVAITGGTIGGASNAAAIGTNSYGARTVSSSAPTGGNNGDIWYQI